jgi:hypothetical protein
MPSIGTDPGACQICRFSRSICDLCRAFSCISRSRAALFGDRCRRSSAPSRHVALLYSLEFFAHRYLKHDRCCHSSARCTHINCNPPPSNYQIKTPAKRIPLCAAYIHTRMFFLAQHKDIQILSRLELGGCHDKSVTFSSQCFPHILPFFQSPSIQYLRYLDFGCMSGLSLGSDGMRLLSPCLPRMQMLQQLGLNRNDIGDAGVETLCLALHQVTSLVSLNLEHNAITHRGCKVLAIAITPLSMLQRLFLCGNGIAARGVRELAPAIVSLSASNLHSSSCIQASSGGGSFEVSLEEELMNVLQLASARWKHGKLQEWRVFVQGTKPKLLCFQKDDFCSVQIL